MSEEQEMPKTTYDTHLHHRNADSLAKERLAGTQTLPELRNADRKRTSISAFKKTATGTMT